MGGDEWRDEMMLREREFYEGDFTVISLFGLLVLR